MPLSVRERQKVPLNVINSKIIHKSDSLFSFPIKYNLTFYTYHCGISIFIWRTIIVRLYLNWTLSVRETFQWCLKTHFGDNIIWCQYFERKPDTTYFLVRDSSLVSLIVLFGRMLFWWLRVVSQRLIVLVFWCLIALHAIFRLFSVFASVMNLSYKWTFSREKKIENLTNDVMHYCRLLRYNNVQSFDFYTQEIQQKNCYLRLFFSFWSESFILFKICKICLKSKNKMINY